MTVRPVMQVSETYSAPTLVAGQPQSWQPSSTTVAEWGTLRIELGAVWDLTATPPSVTTAGTDITEIRGARTIIDSLGFAEPYGETTGQITIPALTELDSHTGDLAWLDTAAGTSIDIWHVLPDDSEVPYWCGFVASVEIASGQGMRTAITLQLAGAFAGETAVRAHQPVMLDSAVDIGTSLGRALDPIEYSRPLPTFTQFVFESDTTGIETRHRGSRGQMTIDYCDEMLGLAQDANVQWTISRAYSVSDVYQGRKYYLREKSEAFVSAIQSSTIHAAGRGVQLQVQADYTERVNSVYGEGTDPEDHSRWRNAVYPMLTPAEPAYPNRLVGSDYPVTTGDDDADFDADVVTQLQYQLAAAGYGADITGTFTADTAAALNRLYDDAGVTQSGEITDNGDWDLVWTTGTGTTELSSGYFRPLSYDKRSDPYTYAPNGAVSGDNNTGDTAYDGRIRVDRVISYGDRISKDRATIHAKRVVHQGADPVWTGTITLTADPIERSRLDLREGGWVVVKFLTGTDLNFYIAGISVGVETAGLPVTLTVSSQPFDLLELQARIERDRIAKDNPARSYYSQRTRPRRPFADVVGWDKESGAGLIHPIALDAGWNVIKIIGAQYGTIEAVDVSTYSPPTKFALAMFGGSVNTTELDTWVPDPLAALGTAGYGHWEIPSIEADLTAHGWIESWGEVGNAAGYYPGFESNGTAKASGTVTGRLLDAMTWEFASLDPPFLWAAVWVAGTAACRFKGEMRIVPTEP